MEALIFGTNRRATFLQACVFARIIDAVHFFIISATLLFRRDQHNRTLVLYAFPAVSLAEMGRSEVEICFAAVMLSSARARASTMPYRPNAARWQISFNACNQLWNANRLDENGRPWIWIPDLPSPFVTRPSERQPVFGAKSDRIQYI